jgi:SAM-dependent methyltransferase
MHPAVFKAFDDICHRRQVRGAVLEIGATPDESTLLNLPSLANTQKTGINRTGPARFRDFEIREADANRLDCFADGTFDAVLCNAVLEHDRFFWKSLAEIRRVVRVGGLVVIGTPGYTELPLERKLRGWLATLAPLSGNPDGLPLQHSTLTLGIHNFPGDYYRFSEQAFREVFFEGMHEVEIRTILVPPRIIGAGIRALA